MKNESFEHSRNSAYFYTISNINFQFKCVITMVGSILGMSFGVMGSMDIARDIYRGYCDYYDYYYNSKICVQIGLLIFVDFFFGDKDVGDKSLRDLILVTSPKVAIRVFPINMLKLSPSTKRCQQPVLHGRTFVHLSIRPPPSTF